MKLRKRAVMAVAVFAAAVNLTGCVYGPPPPEYFDRGEAADIQSGDTEELTPAESGTDTADETLGEA